MLKSTTRQLSFSLRNKTCAVPRRPSVIMSALTTNAALELYPHGITSLTPATDIHNALRRVGTKFEEVPLLTTSLFVKPSSVMYQLDGKMRRWDVVESMPSVGVILYHTDLDAFLMVRQFRPPVYATRLREATAAGKEAPAMTAGFTYELCAGLIDKAKPMNVIVQEEIMEEVGYSVPVEAISFVSDSITSAGTSGSIHSLFFARVDNSMRMDAGGGLPSTGELIEVLALPRSKTNAFVVDSAVPKSPGVQFGLTWAYVNLLEGRLGGLGSNGPVSNLLETGDLLLKSVLPA